MRLLLVLATLCGCFERGDAPKRDHQPSSADDAAVAAVAVDLIDAGIALPEPVDPRGVVDRDARIRVRLEAEPGHLNPLIGESLVARVTIGDVYEGLYCREQPVATPVACLATKVQESGRRIRVTLRDDVLWHDGRAFGADDVVFTYRALSGRKPLASWLTPTVAGLRSVRAISGREVEMVFARPQPRLVELLANIPILPKHVFSAERHMERAAANRAPVGTGPLRFAGWKPGESITFARNDNYWGSPAKAAIISYRIIPSRSRALALLAAGVLDVAPQLPVDEAARVAARAGVQKVQLYGYAQPAFLAAVYNLRRPALAEPSARRGLTMLLDRSSIARRLLGGFVGVATGPFGADSPNTDPAVTALPFDPAAARAALPSRPTLTLLTPTGSRVMGSVADIWASDARGAAGLQVQVLPYTELVARVREGNFDIALMAFTSPRDADFYGRFHSSQIGGENYGAVADDQLDDLLSRARRQVDPSRRIELGRAIHRRLHELQPYAFIADDVRAGLAGASIGGIGRGAGLSARFLTRVRERIW